MVLETELAALRAEVEDEEHRLAEDVRNAEEAEQGPVQFQSADLGDEAGKQEPFL